MTIRLKQTLLVAFVSLLFVESSFALSIQCSGEHQASIHSTPMNPIVVNFDGIMYHRCTDRSTREKLVVFCSGFNRQGQGQDIALQGSLVNGKVPKIAWAIATPGYLDYFKLDLDESLVCR